MIPRSRKFVMALFLGLALCLVTQGQEEIVKIDVSLVTVNVAVTDVKGRPVLNLKRDDFCVSEDEKPVPLQFFDVQAPTSVVFVVDISSSMRGRKWWSLTAELKNFLTNAREGNDYTLVVFNETPRLVINSVPADQLWESFKGIQPAGDTALYDALLMGLTALDRVPQRHRALILLSDGQDNSSHSNIAQVEEEAFSHRATIYSVGILLQPDNLTAYEQSGRDLLAALAAGTGGLVHFPAHDHIREVLDTIEQDLRTQYSLSYYPADKSPGWRQIRVNLTGHQQVRNLRYQQRYQMR